MVTREQLLEYYNTHCDPLSGQWVKRKEHAEFRKSVKELYPFISELGGRVEFSLYVHALLNDINQPPSCIVCGNKIDKVHKKEFPKTCSRKCNGVYVAREQKQVAMSEYGVAHHSQRTEVKQKAIETNLSRYGTPHPMQSDAVKKTHQHAVLDKYGTTNVFAAEAVKEKIKKTNIEKYGADNPMKCSGVKERAVKTNLIKYGVGNPMQCPIVQKKAEQTNIERYGAPTYRNTEDFKNRVARDNIEKYGVSHNKQRHISKESLKLLDDPVWMKENYEVRGGVKLSRILGVDETTVYDRLHKHGIEIAPISTSFAERQINEYIKSLGFETIQSDRSILSGKELDIVVPSRNIAIEYNGLFWHSKKYKENNYHLDKTNQAALAGYRLIHIFEDEWEYRQEQVKEKLASILGVDSRRKVFARKCTTQVISDAKLIKNFYIKNHIQKAGGQSITIGLICDDCVVAMVSFKKRTDDEYELSRYATSARVIGGFSKLLKASKPILTSMGVERLVSFADKRYSVGGVYSENGWKHVMDTPPDYQYVLGDRRERKQNYRRSLLPTKLEKFDPSLSEMQNMIAHDIYPIYDCGLMKFELSLVDDK